MKLVAAALVSLLGCDEVLGLSHFPDAPPFDIATIGDATTGTRIVFVTSQSFTGNLGGLMGAHKKCQNAADGAALPGTYQAWLSGQLIATDPLHSMNLAGGPFVLADPAKTAIAASWPDLTDAMLAHPVDVDEHGNGVSAGRAWTNTLPNGGGAGGSDCVAWTNAATMNATVMGDTTKIDSTWTDTPSMTLCASMERLFCVQQ